MSYQYKNINFFSGILEKIDKLVSTRSIPTQTMTADSWHDISEKYGKWYINFYLKITRRSIYFLEPNLNILFRGCWIGNKLWNVCMTLKFVVYTDRKFFDQFFLWYVDQKKKKNPEKNDNLLPEIEQLMLRGSFSIPDTSVDFDKKNVQCIYNIQAMSNSEATGLDDISVK